MMKPRNAYLGLIWLLVIGPASVIADESLTYDAEIKSIATLGNWAVIGEARMDSRSGIPCSEGGQCSETQLWISSEGGSSLLESTYPLRYLYRTRYRLDTRATLAFEKLRKDRKDKGPGTYRWRHRVVWLPEGADHGMRYDLDASGEPMPEELAAWVTTAKAGDLRLGVKTARRVDMTLPALDRWGTFQLLRTMALERGASWRLVGADTRGNLEFAVEVRGREKLDAGGRTWNAWKVQILEHEPGKPDEQILVWIGDDEAHTPVRIEMDHEIGRMRLTLK